MFGKQGQVASESISGQAVTVGHKGGSETPQNGRKRRKIFVGEAEKQGDEDDDKEDFEVKKSR